MKIILRFLIAFFLIYVAYNLMLPYYKYPIENFEYQILNYFPFNWKSVAIISRLIIGLLFVISFLFIFYWKQIKWVKYISILCISIPFIINPVFPKDLKYDSKILNTPALYESNRNSKEKIQIYVSSQCHHCKEALKKLNTANIHSKHFPQVVVVSYDKQIKKFLEKQKIDFPVDSISAKKFIDITQGVYPQFDYIKDGKVRHHWTNKAFNYAVLDNLSK